MKNIVGKNLNLFNAVCAAYGIQIQDLFDRTRVTRVSEPRMFIIAVLSASGEAAYPELMDAFGFDSKGTIKNARLKMAYYMQFDRRFKIRANIMLAKVYDDGTCFEIIEAVRNQEKVTDGEKLRVGSKIAGG